MKKNSSLNKKTSLASLPPEVLLHCFSFFTSPKDLVSLSKTNHALRSIALDEDLWEKFQVRNKDYYRNIEPEFKRIPPKRGKWTEQIDHIADLGDGYIAITKSGYEYNIVYILDTVHFKLLGEIEVDPLRYGEYQICCGIKAIIGLGNKQFALGLANGTIQVWALEFADESKWRAKIKKMSHTYITGKRIRTITMCQNHKPCGIRALTTLPNGHLVSGGCWQGEISIFNISNGKCVKNIKVSKLRIIGLFTLTATKLAICSGTDTCFSEGEEKIEHCQLSIWDIVNDVCISTLSNWDEELGSDHPLGCSLQKISNDYLACATGFSIRLWNISDESCITLQSKNSKYVSYKRNPYQNSLTLLGGGELVSWSPQHGIIRIWNTNAGNAYSYFQKERSLKVPDFRPKNGGSPYRVKGAIVKLADGRLVCGNHYDGLNILKYPRVPENLLDDNTVNGEEYEDTHKCRMM